MKASYMVRSCSALEAKYPIPQQEIVKNTLNNMWLEARQYAVEKIADFDEIFTTVEKLSKPYQVSALQKVLYMAWQICCDQVTAMPVIEAAARKKLLFDHLLTFKKVKEYSGETEAIIYCTLSAFQGVHPDVFLNSSGGEDFSLLCKHWIDFLRKNPNISSASYKALQLEIDHIHHEEPANKYRLLYTKLVEFKAKQQNAGCLTQLWHWLQAQSREEEHITLLMSKEDPIIKFQP